MPDHALCLFETNPTSLQFSFQLSQRIFVIALQNCPNLFLVRLTHSQRQLEYLFHSLLSLWVATDKEVGAGLFQIIFDYLGDRSHKRYILAMQVGCVLLEDVKLLKLFLFFTGEN